MKAFIVLSCLLACAYALPDLSKWNEWKKQHGRNYAAEEELARQKIFFRNLKKIEAHNKRADAGIHTYRMAVNKFADLTAEEFASKMNRMKYNPFTTKPRNVVKVNVTGDVPTSIDWRTKGVVGPIKDQGQCGSCWAFSAIASTEAAHALATGNLTLLSEQNLVDCSQDYGNYGCDGGLPDQAFDYIIANGGVDTEASYPYEAEDDTCRYKAKNVGSTIASYVDLPTGDESALQAATATIGPISVGIDASSDSFQFYSSGVYVDDYCTTNWLDHGVAVVGYDSLDGQAYWTVRNSWGEDWGLNGYILMARNRNNMCGIATLASYPVVNKN